MLVADPVVVDLSVPRRIHVIGIGGAGMSAIAAVLIEMGHRVSGSDLKASPTTERLAALGVTISVGHHAAHIADDTEIVTRSTAVPDHNPEVQEARRRGLPVARRADTLAAISATRRTVAVCGTHGKTTTASLLALALLDAGHRPSFIIGGELNEIGGGASWVPDGDLFVVEADESDGTFLELTCHGVVITSVEPDHLDHWVTVDALRDAFVAVARAAAGPVVACADDPGAAAVAAHVDAVTYGFDPASVVQIVDHAPDRGGQRFRLRRHGHHLADVDLAVPGIHNARNAAAAFTMAVELGADAAAVAAGLARYTGVARRFEPRGEVGGVRFVDDYAHLPTEVALTIDAARGLDPERLICVFQPHRYSRTESLWADFAGAFDGVDHLIVTGIYPAGEAPRPGITGRLVADAVTASAGSPPVTYVARRRDVAGVVGAILRPGDLCLTLGAGDLTTLPTELVDVLGGDAT
jgi:UDP-N-acetylmuramate--alanine ligase